jgi:phospholipid/cholesterol/gamma-HCH transport system substrate-binding protein
LTRTIITRVLTVAVIVALVAGLAVHFLGSHYRYEVTVVFPEATDLESGSLVEVNGFDVGNVARLAVNDGQAMVTVAVKGPNDPLHTGTKATIDYKALLGERYVELVPGPKSNPTIPNHGVITGGENRVELAQALDSLNPATRKQLQKDIPQLSTLTGGTNTNNIQQTLTDAAPTIQALSAVLSAVGSDGVALKNLVTGMEQLTTRLNTKQSSLVSTVSGLDQTFDAVAKQDTALQSSISALPATLTQANTTLKMLPTTTQDVLPLLSDLQPGAAALPAFAAKLKPVADELQPVVTDLEPTLTGLNTLLTYTPNLESSLNSVVPGVQTALTTLETNQTLNTATGTETSNALDFLRPYTPELAGFVTNWSNWLSAYNDTGHVAPIAVEYGIAALDLQPSDNNYTAPSTIVGPTQDTCPSDALSALTCTVTNAQNPPSPGTETGQPWTTGTQAVDAAGNPVG